MPRRPTTERERAAQQVVGDTIRALRSQAGLSQEDLAHVAGLHRTYIGHVERGHTNPTLGTLLTIADALNTNVAELVRRV